MDICGNKKGQKPAIYQESYNFMDVPIVFFLRELRALRGKKKYKVRVSRRESSVIPRFQAGLPSLSIY